jgi:hypothetical protein
MFRTIACRIVGALVIGAGLGAALSLAVQAVIQLYVVPRPEVRKRREDRWERDVRELSELITTQLSERAANAWDAQAIFREKRQDGGDVDPAVLAHCALDVQRSMWAFRDIAHARMNLAVSSRSDLQRLPSSGAGCGTIRSG